MSVTEITDENFESEVLSSKRPVLVDFWASYCSPCKMLSPVIDNIARENPDIKVGKVNVEKEQELAGKFNVMSVPTLMVFNDRSSAKRKNFRNVLICDAFKLN